MGTYNKLQQRELDQKPVAKPIVWSMGNQEIRDTFNSFAEYDSEASTDALIQMTADACSVSYSRVVEALRSNK